MSIMEYYLKIGIYWLHFWTITSFKSGFKLLEDIIYGIFNGLINPVKKFKSCFRYKWNYNRHIHWNLQDFDFAFQYHEEAFPFNLPLIYHAEHLSRIRNIYSGCRNASSVSILLVQQVFGDEFNLPLHQLYIDFKQAFDTINRNYIFDAMAEFGIPRKLIALTKMKY